MPNVTRGEMMEKYGEVELTFSNYHKHSSTIPGKISFIGTAGGTAPDGVELVASIMDPASDNYRRGKAPETLRELDPTWLCAIDADGNKIGEWSSNSR